MSNKRCHAKATTRKNGNKYLTVEVPFTLSLYDLLVAYLLRSGVRDYISATAEQHLDTMPLPEHKTSAMLKVTETLVEYGNDFTTRTEEFPDHNWEAHPQVLKIKAKLAELFDF